MFGLCKYKDSLGIPGKGIHFHVFGIAIVDVMLTFGGAYIINRITGGNYLWTIFGSLLAMGFLLHHIFCVKTTVNTLLGDIILQKKD